MTLRQLEQTPEQLLRERKVEQQEVREQWGRLAAVRAEQLAAAAAAAAAAECSLSESLTVMNELLWIKILTNINGSIAETPEC